MRSLLSRRAYIVLLSVNQEAEGGVDDVKLRIDAKRGGEEDRAVGAVAVEEVAIVEVAVAAGKGNRLWCLVNRIVVAECEHRRFLVVLEQAYRPVRRRQANVNWIGWAEPQKAGTCSITGGGV
jgi:hypothetical protein